MTDDVEAIRSFEHRLTRLEILWTVDTALLSIIVLQLFHVIIPAI